MSNLTLLIRAEKKMFKGSGLKPGHKRVRDDAAWFIHEGVLRSKTGRGVKKLSKTAGTNQMRDSYEHKPAF